VLPPRLSVFGAATLPPAFLQLLGRIATHVPVDLYVPRPTLHYVGDQRGRAGEGDHGLLLRLGIESREFADRLLDAEQPAPASEPLIAVDAALAADDDPEATPATLLACVQHDLVHAIDRDGRRAPRFVIATDDASLRVHVCHSPHRELEVVRDQIFAAFAADPTLSPHDVLVLVPDIDRYAPYAHAVFGTTEKELPFRVVDRSPARERPVCSTLLHLLRLARDRLTVFDVLHVLENAAVQRRFRLFPSDVPTLRHLCQRAGIRWGVDADSRARHHDVPPFAENSWRQGITRLVLGLATGPTDDVVLGQLPVGGVTAAHQDLLGRFLTLLGTLFPALEALAGTRPLAEWADVLDHTVAGMFLASDGDDEAGLQQLAAATAELRRIATTARHTKQVAPAVIGDWLDQQLGQGSGGHGFLGGPVTIAAMLPLRAVPVRCLFLCGLDDASFPHQDHPAPFDLMAAARRPGDRSRRLDDRQLCLDLLLAARERLQLTYVGRSAKDNSLVTPSIVLTELLEHLDRTCVAAGGGNVRERVVVEHPLQPWSPRYSDGNDPRLFSFANRNSLPAVPLRRPEPVWIAAAPAPAAPP
ncbi:MAG: exodeoxyribonuclease V subunit gamma, partial [Planctomycetes bacterium]|nr:exodeoxyribonuclease V subunit gamma [Planctomycetota bacterium]